MLSTSCFIAFLLLLTIPTCIPHSLVPSQAIPPKELPPTPVHTINTRQVSQFESCGVKDETFVCDPDELLTQPERDQLARYLNSLEADTHNPFGKTDCERKGLTVGVAISKAILTSIEEVATTKLPPLPPAPQGHDWNEHNHASHDEPASDEVVSILSGEPQKDAPPGAQMDHLHFNHIIPMLPVPPPPPLPVATPDPQLIPCFVQGGLTLTQLLTHQVDNNNRFARELVREWGMDNDTCPEKLAIVLLSPMDQEATDVTNDFGCNYPDGKGLFRNKRYLDGLIEMLDQQRQVYMDARYFSAIEMCRSLALPGVQAESIPTEKPMTTSTTPRPQSAVASGDGVTMLPGSSSSTRITQKPVTKEPLPTTAKWNPSNYANYNTLPSAGTAVPPSYGVVQLQSSKPQVVQCSANNTTNTLLILLFLTISSQTLLLVAIVVLKMRGFFNKPTVQPSTLVQPTTTTVSPPPMYNHGKASMTPPSFFDHLEDRKAPGYYR